MKLLLLLTCGDLYSYNEEYVSYTCKVIEKEQDINKYKVSRQKYLGIVSSWEQGVLISSSPGEIPNMQVVWDERVPLKTKIVLNARVMEVKKTTINKTLGGNVPMANDWFVDVINPPQANGLNNGGQ